MGRQIGYSTTPEAQIDDTDLILGLDKNGGTTTTKNFKVGDLKEHFNEGSDFTISTYPGRIASINEDGTGAESSGIYKSFTDITTMVTIGGDDADESSKGTWKIENTGDGYQLTIKNYTGKYYLPSFVDNTITITESGLYDDVSSDDPLLGSIGDIVIDEDNDNKEYFYDSSDDSFTVKFEFERDTESNDNWDGKTGTQTLNVFEVDAKDDNSTVIQEIDVTFGVNVSFDKMIISGTEGTLTDEGVVTNPDLDVAGLAQVNELHVETLTVAGNAATPEADFELHGSLHINAHTGEGVIFGDEADGVEFTVANNDLSIGGAGNITIGSGTDRTLTIQSPVSASGNFTQTGSGTFTIAGDSITTASGSLEIITANSESGDNQGQLTAIKIGDDYWTIAGSGQNLSLLPGLTQDTTGADGADNNVNNLFVATQSENTLTFVRQEQLDNNPANSAGAVIAAISISDNATAFTIGSANNDRDDFNDIWSALSGDERLFFADSDASFDSTTAAVNDTTTATSADGSSNIIYQITSYDDSNGEGTIARVGGGTINLSSAEIKVTSIPTFSSAQNNEEFLLRDNTDNTLHSRALSTATVQGARYGDSDTGISSITYAGGDHLIDLSSAASPSIDISGRYEVELQNDDFTAEAFHCYVLQAPDGNTDKTVSLPAGQKGDSIKFNMQEDPGDSTGEWSIVREGTQKIESDNTLVLDHKMNFELIYSGDDTIGWILI